MSFRLAMICMLGGALLGCASDPPSPENHDVHDGGGADGTTNSSDDAGDADVAALSAPTLDSVLKMSGGLHVLWTNNQKGCDAVEGERKTDTEAYRVAFTVPDGTVDNKHDAPLTAGVTYSYRLRCKKGSEYSPYSNEMSGTP